MKNKKTDDASELDLLVEPRESFLAEQSKSQSSTTITSSKGASISGSANIQKTPTSEKKRKHQMMSQEERREERRAANRRSAFTSRQRRKVLVEELQETVQAMSKENAAMSKEANNLRIQVDMLMCENRQLRLQQQLSSDRLPMGLPEISSHQQVGGGGDMWVSMHQQQGMVATNNGGGMVSGISAMDQYFNSDVQNVGSMLGAFAHQSGIEMSNPIQAPPTNALFAEQTREYLRGLSDRNNPMF